MAEARSRKMASMKEIRQYWGIPEGVCFRCRRNAQVVRGHVIAHSAGGTGDVSNLVPLCHLCNRLCIPWGPADSRVAWAWIRMDAATYSAETLGWGVDEELKNWIKERDDLPEGDQATLADLINFHLREWLAATKLRAEIWATEIRQPGSDQQQSRWLWDRGLY